MQVLKFQGLSTPDRVGQLTVGGAENTSYAYPRHIHMYRECNAFLNLWHGN